MSTVRRRLFPYPNIFDDSSSDSDSDSAESGDDDQSCTCDSNDIDCRICVPVVEDDDITDDRRRFSMARRCMLRRRKVCSFRL